jgi:hypothetical protein
MGKRLLREHVDNTQVKNEGRGSRSAPVPDLVKIRHAKRVADGTVGMTDA